MTAWLLKFAWRILAFSIPVPIGLILVAGIAWKVSEGTAVHRAVKEKTLELVTGGELAAKEAEIRAGLARENALSDELTRLERLRKADSEALRTLQAAQAISEIEKQDLQDEIDDILASRTESIPTLGNSGVYGRLRWQ